MILVAIILGLFLRLYRLSQLFYFTHDEETIAWRVMPLIRDNNPFLLGGVTPFHVHLGPWFYYLSAAILKLSHFDPLGWGIAAAVVSLATMWLVFYSGKLFFGSRVGIIALLLSAVSFLMIAFDRHWWPLYFNPLITLVTLLALYQIIKGRSIYLIPLSLALAFGFHTDPSTWALLLLTITAWIRFKPKITKQYLYISLFIFIVSFLPLIIFDLRNEGVNLTGINQYFTETKAHQGLSWQRFWWVLLYIPRSLSRLLYAGTSDLSASYAYCPPLAYGRLQRISWPLLFTPITILLIFLFTAWRHRRQPQYWLIGSYFGLIFFGLNLYGNFFNSDLFDHYLTTLFPVFFLLTAWILNRLWRPVTILALLAFMISNLILFSRITTQDSYSAKRQGVNWAISQVADQPFALDSLSSCFRYNGVRYLFMLAGKEPAQSFVDQNFSWLYQSPPAVAPLTKQVIFVHQNHTEPLPVGAISSRTFGSWTVLILDTAAPTQ